MPAPPPPPLWLLLLLLLDELLGLLLDDDDGVDGLLLLLLDDGLLLPAFMCAISAFSCATSCSRFLSLLLLLCFLGLGATVFLRPTNSGALEGVGSLAAEPPSVPWTLDTCWAPGRNTTLPSESFPV